MSHPEEGLPGGSSVSMEPRQSLLRRKINSSGAEIRSILELGRQAAEDPTHLVVFRGSFRSINQWFDYFQHAWDDLLEHYALVDDRNYPDESDKRLCSSIKRYFTEANTLYEELVVMAQPKPPLPSANQTIWGHPESTMRATTRAHLPRLTLPKFSGKLIEWPHFRDLFISIVHDDIAIPNIDKFHYLASSLSGPALAVVSKLSITDSNYLLAWTALNKAYDNKRLLASSYLKQCMDFAPLKKGNLENLKTFLSVIAENISALKRLKIPNLSEFILFNLAVRSLDSKTRESFEKDFVNVDYPEFDNLIDFVRDRCQVLELSSEINFDSLARENEVKKSKTNSRAASLFAKEFTESTPSFKGSKDTSVGVKDQSSRKSIMNRCPCCQENHFLWRCSGFKRKSLEEKRRLIKQWRCCHNCLQSGHIANDCKSKSTCYVCSRNHHTLLHSPNSFNTSQSDPKPNTSTEPCVKSTLTSASECDVILGTAIACIKDVSGNFKKIRLVVDSGSHYSFITTEAAESLGLKPSSFRKRIMGVGQNLLEGIRGSVDCLLKPNRMSSTSRPLCSKAIVVNSITSFLPCTKISIPHWFDKYQDKLADPDFFTPSKIEFLLGADLFTEILTGPCVKSPDGPTLLDTAFGLVVIGKVPTDSDNTFSSLFVNETSLTEAVRCFWEVEEPQPVHIVSPEAELCEAHHESTHYRLPSGKFGVRLPFKVHDPTFNGSETIALKRFYSLERKLIKNSEHYAEYKTFMQDYISLGHMRVATESSKYVIPHHGVLKTNNFRVVFDASCHVGGHSLNDALMIGPKLQKDICTILLCFRLHKIAFITDMVKMYRQIEMDPRDRSYQHIFWRFDPSERIIKYELCTITYGLSSSPYQALRIVQQLIEDEGHAFPVASKVLREDLYIDDIVTGAPTFKEAQNCKLELINLLRRGGFQLSKWRSNCPELLSTKESQQNPMEFSVDEQSAVKVLGLQWDPTEDFFIYRISKTPSIPTKRTILSVIARIFDPVGFLAPVILYAKVLFQATWKSEIDWDEPVPTKIQTRWKELVQELPLLSNLHIPRYLPDALNNKCDILCFCDASELGYSAVIYLHVLANRKTYLLKSKTKLAPLKTLTIPKLELSGALLLTRLYLSLKPFLSRIEINRTYCFTDSSVVLGWLQTEPYLLKIFVANRVVEITKDLPAPFWFHIKSTDNPADCASKGTLPSKLLNHPLWWTGPSWLSLPYIEWPLFQHKPVGNLPELKPRSNTLVTVTPSQYLLDIIEKYSSYQKLLRVIAYVLRFIRNSTHPTDRWAGPLKVHELKAAKLACVKAVQTVYYPKRDDLSLKDLKSLTPFVDKGGILRVGGRLARSTLSMDFKHPIILPKHAHFSILIVDYFHKINLHAGPSLLNSILRHEFWIISPRSLIRKRIFNCLKCYKAKARLPSQLMGNLPPCRLQGGRVFQQVGVDFAGPFPIRESLRRKATSGKAYLCIFVCMASKALHLEIVTSLSTEAFLATLDRFIARRGKPATIYSDCGSNFLGAANHLRELRKWYLTDTTQVQITDHLSSSEIEWSFNPPYAPHFGGLWEAGVKSVKVILRKFMTDPSFTLEELMTMFCRIEAILNSRPLCPLTEDSEDYNYLTPGHFLIGAPLIAAPEASLLGLKENKLSRWQLVQKRIQEVWHRWRNEYLHHLQRRNKWTKEQPNLNEGDLVILAEPHTKPLDWPMGRIVQVHPGRDNLVRVVTVKNHKGKFTRPITKVIPLLRSNHNSSTD